MLNTVGLNCCLGLPKLDLEQYTPISLAEMGRVALLNRTDTKYVLSLDALRPIMTELITSYATLEVQGSRMSHYRTLYFDSADFDLYRRHHAGMLNRYKVRSREYVDSQLAFMEVKHKTNKGRTIKRRLQTPVLADEIEAETAVFHEWSAQTARLGPAYDLKTIDVLAITNQVVTELGSEHICI